MYKNVIRPILTFSAETRANTTKTKKNGNSWNERVKTVGKMRTDHIRSWDIRHQYGIKETGEWVNICRTKYNNCKSRMAPTRTVWTATDISPKERQSPGRQHKILWDSHSGGKRPIAQSRGGKEEEGKYKQQPRWRLLLRFLLPSGDPSYVMCSPRISWPTEFPYSPLAYRIYQLN
jgi:hypothetical protein